MTLQRKTPVTILSSVSARMIKADVQGEFNGLELKGFAAAFGIDGKVKPGKSEDVNSEFCLLIKAADAVSALKMMVKAGYVMDDRTKTDGVVTAKMKKVTSTFSFDPMFKSDCVMTVTAG